VTRTNETSWPGKWPEAAASDRDLSLQLGRRLDWRFLLPEPSFDRVAYFGPENAMLARALRALCPGAEICSQAARRIDQGGFQLAVVTSGEVSDLRAAYSALSPGSMVYLELSRRRLGAFFKPLFLWPLQSPDSRLALFRQIGFQDLKIYWCWPDFENCREILPLDSPEVLEWTWLTRAADVVPPWLLAVGRVLICRGWIPCLAGSLAIVGRKP
jgi:hypothetical protein